MLDPLIFRLITLLFALLLITAGTHKLGDLLRFQGILRDYQILPAQLVGGVSLLLPVAEILIGLGWALLWRIDLVSMMSAALLASYAFAMGLNLWRGRTYIDCGCSFSSAKNRNGNSGTQQLSIWLIYRNGLLIVLALLTNLDLATRTLGSLDYFALLAASLTLIFAYSAFNQLLVNHNAIDSWRKPLLQRLTINHSQDIL